MKPIWIVIITAVVMAGLGAGGYYYLNGKSVKEKNDLQSQIDGLNSKISADSVSTTNSSSTSSASTGSVVTGDETSNWQTYSSSDYGYSIQFPKTMYFKGNKVQQMPGDVGAQDLIISDVQNMGIQDILPNEKIHIDVTTNASNGKTLAQFVDGYGLSGTISNKQTISLGSVQAIQLTDSGDVGLTVYTFVLKGNYAYIIRSTNGLTNDNVNSENYAEMARIVGTFQFTK
jgi:hypothetical protein